MKLHTTIINENGTKVSKGGNEKITIGLNKGNRNVASIDFTQDYIKIWYEGNKYWSTELQGKSQKGEVDCIICGEKLNKDISCPNGCH
jgi:hypothetical protein